ncbi:MAG: hypothetical protein KF812_06880 [Fimbriimonadaceae bacterium]|nr:hypothetical protein [Fimbriimonadaceae bacterium]
MSCGYSRRSGFASLSAQRDQRDFPSLCAWIDEQYDGSPDQLWSAWSSMVATVAIILAIGSAVLDDRIPGFGSFPIWGLYGASVGVSAIVLHFITLRRRIRDSRAHGNQFVNTRQSLIQARKNGDLKNLLGIGGAEKMDRAAAALLRIKAAFDTEEWRSSQGGVYSSARDNAIASAEAAMSRLILMMSTRGPSEDANKIVDDLNALASEAEQLTQASGRDRSAESGLREALSELREIRKATEEAQDTLTLPE